MTLQVAAGRNNSSISYSISRSSQCGNTQALPLVKKTLGPPLILRFRDMEQVQDLVQLQFLVYEMALILSRMVLRIRVEVACLPTLRIISNCPTGRRLISISHRNSSLCVTIITLHIRTISSGLPKANFSIVMGVDQWKTMALRSSHRRRR